MYIYIFLCCELAQYISKLYIYIFLCCELAQYISKLFYYKLSLYIKAIFCYTLALYKAHPSPAHNNVHLLCWSPKINQVYSHTVLLKIISVYRKAIFWYKLLVCVNRSNILLKIIALHMQSFPKN